MNNKTLFFAGESPPFLKCSWKSSSASNDHSGDGSGCNNMKKI
jgi:hypothetical protein